MKSTIPFRRGGSANSWSGPRHGADNGVIEPLEKRRLLSTVTINSGELEQVIGGLGGNYAEGAFNSVVNDSVGQFALTNLAPKQVRVAIPIDLWEPSANTQPGNLQSPSFQDTGSVHQAFLLLQQLQASGATIMGSIWNLPNWMVSNPSATNSRLLPAANIPALSEAISAFILRAYDNYGVTISTVSLNEADGGTNTYLPSSEEATLIKTAGAQFATLGLPTTTKWVVGDTSVAGTAVSYITPILQDPATLPFIAAVGYHGWASTQLGQSDFAAIQTMASQYGLPVWATEVSYEYGNGAAVNSWTDASQTAQNYFKAIAWAGASNVLYWDYQNDLPILNKLDQPYPVYYVLQQMVDALPAGSQVLSSGSDDPNILPIAAQGPANGEFDLLVQNTNTVATQVTYNGLPNGTYSLMTSDAAENEVVSATFTVAGGSATLTLPPASVDTITNTASSLPSTPDNVVVSPGTATLAPGASQQFSGVSFDQTGAQLPSQPTLTWSLDPGSVGTIDPVTGIYTGPQTGGSAIVRATATTSNAITGTIAIFTNPASSALPSGWTDADIGAPAIAGTASFDGTTWGVAGGGFDIWGLSDQYNFAYQSANGAVTVVAKVTGLTTTDSVWAKAGIMLRASNQGNSAFADLVATPEQGLNFMYRATTGAEAVAQGSVGIGAPAWVELTYSPTTQTVTASFSNDATNTLANVNWTQLSSQTIAFPSTLLAGLAVTANDNSALNAATFTNVSVNGASAQPPVAVAHTPTISNATTVQGVQSTTGLVITPNALDASNANLAYQITGITGGTLFLSNGTTAISNGQFITAAQGAAGLQFLPTAGMASPASTFGFSVQASADGTVAGLGGSIIAGTITVSAASVGQLVGTPSADTTLSWASDGNTYLNVFDNNTNTYFDAPTANGNWVQLNFSAPQTITAIAFAPRDYFEYRMNGGVFEASNDPTFTTGVATLYTVNANPADGLNTQTVSPSAAYQYVRYVSPNGSYGDIAEMQVTGAAATGSGSTGTGGTGSGSTGTGSTGTGSGSTTPVQLVPASTTANTTSSYDSKSSDNFTAVFDGNTSTAFDAPSGNGDYVQANLSTAQTIAQIAYAPRAGFEYRMVGGIFEASNDPTFSTGVVNLFTVSSTPSDGLTTQSVSTSGTYQYIRYVAPNGSYGNIAEMQIFGSASTGSTGTGSTGTGSTGTGSTGTGSGSTTPVQLVPASTTANTTSSYDGKSSDNFTAVFDGNTSTAFDAPSGNGDYVQANLSTAQTIAQIAYAPRTGFEYRMVGGIFEASNDPTFSTGVVNLFTVSSTPSDGLTTQSVSTSGTYQYIRYVAPNGSYGNIAEMQIFGSASTGSTGTGSTGTGSTGTGSTGTGTTGSGGSSATPAQLVPTSTTANTTSSYDGKSGDNFSAAFDGNTNTAFDAPGANGNFVQANFAAAHNLTSIAYAPRAGFESRMIGGIFEGSNDPTFSTGVVSLYTVPSTPADGLNIQSFSVGGSYQYVRYVAPAGSYGNIAEMQVFGY